MTHRWPLTLGRAAAALLALTLWIAATTLAVAQPAAEPSYRYLTQRGDTMIGLGRRVLIEPSAWREVARFNRLKNPNQIPARGYLDIPLRLLRNDVAPARVEQVVGEVRAGNGATTVALRGGEDLPEGAQVQTGRDGFAVVRLADGSLLRLSHSSQLQIERARSYPSLGQIDSGVKLDRGRVEVQAPKASAGKPGFEVRTPQGLLGVRGTAFRVSASDALKVTGGEVIEGAVQVSGAPRARGRRVGAGLGTVVDAQQRVAEPKPLLKAPNLAAMPTLHERLVLRFPVPKLAGAVSFRGQVARDAQMREVLADNLAEGPELRFTNLDDGDYVLRVRAIDALGLEGFDSTLAFRLKARPEPPMPSAPRPRGVTRGTKVSLEWTINPDATSYRLQVASDEGFKNVLRDVPGIAGATFELDNMTPGDYFWRLASVRGEKDQGPWGNARGFTVRPPPPTPPPPSIGATSLQFTWETEPGQTFEFQLARDAAFKQIVLERALDRPELELPRPAGGVYFMRLRARDADGFLGPFTTPQSFEIVDCVKSGDGVCMRTGAGVMLRQP